LIPTDYHDRTYVYIQKKVPASKRWEGQNIIIYNI
jgi:hypothetical protein